ncbi:MAG TPA: trypsin-like peptidase domain-containing protein [Candidatus Saccharimonadales bacterium]|nr:trypsin-like peptidase domain-containing protein [Candidatus Saccharimonadales bacterium]
MATVAEIILILDADPARREFLQKILQEAGLDVRHAPGFDGVAQQIADAHPDVALLAADPIDSGFAQLIASIKEKPAAEAPRLVVLTGDATEQRIRALQAGADDALGTPWEPEELIARVRAQLREQRALRDLDRKIRNAEDSYQVAQTAFQALAVTEKMTRDAFSLERILKIGVGVLFALSLVIAGIFFLFSRKAEKETTRAYTVISQLERSALTQEQLLVSARKFREDPNNADVLQQKEQLQQQTETLRQKLASAGGDVNELRRQLDETTGRLSKLETNAESAEAVIRDYAPSVCLLHVSVAFNEKNSGRRLRYGGITADGEPLKDSDGKTVYTTEGKAPELRADFFGTGFIAGEGKIITNHHVVQPWWQNEELAPILQQGLDPVIAEITAYFPGENNGIPVGISQISPDADLALVHGDLSVLKRPILKIDVRKDAAVSGEGMISLGYATGLDAILARAGDDTVKQIVSTTGGDPKLVLAELASRHLIRPLVTQGHVGDVLPDKIVYDAQMTSGGSGGPILNRQGGVIGVTFAVVRGFGGSNFGVPIRFATPLLKH